MAFTYILYSKTLDKYYIGSTEGTLEARLKKHLSNHNGFTGKSKDWILVYHEEYEDKQDALKREMQIKSWKSLKLFEILINSKDI
jgi:putative endonuclease